MIVKNKTNGRLLMLDVDDGEFIALAYAKRSMPRLRVEARTLDLKRLFLVAFADLEPVYNQNSDLNGLAARSSS